MARLWILSMRVPRRRRDNGSPWHSFPVVHSFPSAQGRVDHTSTYTKMEIPSSRPSLASSRYLPLPEAADGWLAIWRDLWIEQVKPPRHGLGKCMRLVGLYSCSSYSDLISFSYQERHRGKYALHDTNWITSVCSNCTMLVISSLCHIFESTWRTLRGK